LECKDRYLNETCGCVNIEPPLNNLGYQSCTLKQWAQCGLKAYMDFNSAYMNPKLAENICPCPSACNETRYVAQLSTSALSHPYVTTVHSHPFIKGLLSEFSHPDLNITYESHRDIHENLVVMEILFTSMITTEIRQVVTYTSANLLGDIGGVMGLLMGASVFTLIDFVQMLVFAIQKHCFSNWCRKEKAEKSGDNEEASCLKKEEEEDGC